MTNNTVKCRDQKSNGHPSEFININGEQVEIDKELIPLIKELNKVGLITTQCCQGGKGTLADNKEVDYPTHIIFELGSNVQVSIKPLGPYDKQNLVIYWKKNKKVLY